MPKSTAIVTAAPSKPHTQSAELDGTAPWLAFEGKGNNDGIYDDTELADLLKRLCGAHALSSGDALGAARVRCDWDRHVYVFCATIAAMLLPIKIAAGAR